MLQVQQAAMRPTLPVNLTIEPSQNRPGLGKGSIFAVFFLILRQFT
jgi:hypothetical protein